MRVLLASLAFALVGASGTASDGVIDGKSLTKNLEFYKKHDLDERAAHVEQVKEVFKPLKDTLTS